MASPRREQISLLEALLQDEDLERLETLTHEFNVFEVLHAVRQEIRHSNFLAWLLDPSGNHGLGDYFAKLFLRKTTLLARDQEIDSLSAVEIDVLDLSRVVVRTEWRGIDILLIAEDQKFVCAIENKVDSGEHSDQLARYAKTCTSEFPDCDCHFVFLSSDGIDASQPGWVAIGYQQIAQLVERALRAKGTSMGDEVALFLRHYVNMLRRHIVRESEIGALCQKIYREHRQALDLLFEYRPDTQAEVRRILEELIAPDSDFEFDSESKKSYVNFLPRSWTSRYIRETGTWGWILKLMFQNRPDSLSLYLEILPGDAAVRSRIHEAARASRVLKAPAKLSPQFCRVYKRDFLRAQDYEQPLEALEEQIKQKMLTFKTNDLPEIGGVIQAIEFSDILAEPGDVTKT